MMEQVEECSIQDPDLYSCQFCDDNFPSIKDLAQHMVRNHEKEQNHHTDNDSNNKNEIEVSHTPNRCDKCEKIFSRPYTLKVHQPLCRGAPPLSCSQCFKEFTNQQNRRRHEATCNGPPPPPVTSINNGTINNGTINNNINNGTINNNIIINFPTTLSDTPVFIQTEAQRKLLLDYVKTKSFETPEEILNGIMLFFQDSSMLPFRKENLHMPYTHIHQQGEWKLHLDDDVYPKVVLQTSHDMVNVLQDTNAQMMVANPNPRSSMQRLMSQMDRKSDKIGDFFDHVDDTEKRGMDQRGRIEMKEQVHRKAYKRAKNKLKLTAHEAAKQFGLNFNNGQGEGTSIHPEMAIELEAH